MISPLRNRARAALRSRTSGDATGTPDWVRDIAEVGEGPGWFDPDGVVWEVHGGLSTLVGGVVALLGQGVHPLALAGIQQHSSYRDDPWARLAGTAQWLVVSTFGSSELAERESARVRGKHGKVQGTGPDGRAYSASDPDLLRWVHLAFTDAFLAAQEAIGADLTPRFGKRWRDTYVSEWAVTAERLGATDLPYDEEGLAEAIADYAPVLEPVPDDLRRFLLSPPGLSLPERLFYAGLARTASLLVSPTIAPLAGVPGRSAFRPGQRRLGKLQVQSLRAVLGTSGPAEQAARWRAGLGPQPEWATADA